MKTVYPKHDRMVCADVSTCTAARSKAIEDGEALLARMKGSGWKLRVWENLGWHYAVHSGPLTIHASVFWNQPVTYFALMSDTPEGGFGGAAMWTKRGVRSRDPNRVARAQVAHAAQVVAEFTKAVEAGKRAVGL